MALVMGMLHAEDYEAWKRGFDADPRGYRQSARGHKIFRSVDDPAQVFVGIEFASTQEAHKLLPALAASPYFGKAGSPTVAELIDDVRY